MESGRWDFQKYTNTITFVSKAVLTKTVVRAGKWFKIASISLGIFFLICSIPIFSNPLCSISPLLIGTKGKWWIIYDLSWEYKLGKEGYWYTLGNLLRATRF